MRSSLLTFAAVCLLAGASLASGPRETVNDKDSDVIVNTFGNCVRTKWQSADDVCAPKKEEPKPVVQAPPPAPEPVIGREARTVYFNFDDASLTMDAVQKLDALSSQVAMSKAIVAASVVGYADKIGNADYNVKLSQQRATAVKQYLDTKLNIPTSVAEVQGLGSITTTTECDGLKRAEKINCLSNDRRVEVQFTYQQ